MITIDSARSVAPEGRPETPARPDGYELELWWGDRTLRASGARAVMDVDRRHGALAGALPFDPRGVPALFEVDRIDFGRAEAPASEVGSPVTSAASSGASSETVRIIPRPSRSEYTRLVAGLVEALRAHRDHAGILRKVVLARRLDVTRAEPFDLDALARRLRRDRAVTTFLLRPPDGGSETSPALVGASPELLVEKRGRMAFSRPLAGSAARGACASADREIADRLLRSTKDLEEHRFVVEHVLDTLAPYCSSLTAPPIPTLARTDTMWHLETKIEGELEDPDVTSIELARRLHPTPAVCGTPYPESARLIEDLEPFRRGLYAGAVGWNEASGDGRWMVTLRCAEVFGSSAALYAGAGIVADSEPRAECEETSAKFGALLEALELDEGSVGGGCG